MKRLAMLLPLAVPGCTKAPLHDVAAGFLVADAAWFAEEQTLFVFYEVEAEQGLGEPSVIEVTWTTDDEIVPWTPVGELPSVHTHLPVDCGIHALCGSNSVRVPIRPRDVQIRLRYHRDGALSLNPETTFNVVDAGAPYTNRSLVVYGVFDEFNEFVQWRARHQFPTLRNEEVTELGLRRDFVIRDQGFGTATLSSDRNPYGYGASCPSSFVAMGFQPLETDQRARFNAEPLPLGASDATTVCAQATVTDATGTFTTGAIARKNPEVKAAFPTLRSPVRDATPLRFFLGPCERTISAEHEAMQRQRLQLGGVPTLCTDRWKEPGFVDELVVAFRDAVEAERPAGDDMVLVIALNQDDDGLSELLEDALAEVVPGERLRSTPRLAGAFVLDSTIRGLSTDELAPVTLWCPSTIPLDEIPDASARSCAILPDNPSFDLGPFSFGSLPILPSRDQYLDFIDTWSDAQAGQVDALEFRAPEFAATADHIDFGEFGAVTFLNNERIGTDADDAFSFCTGDDLPLVVFRSQLMDSDQFLYLLPYCRDLGLPRDVCETALQGGVPLEYLPDWHGVFGEDDYELGVFWDFPFLLRMDYRLVQAGAVSAFGFSVPFGIGSSEESYYGTELWTLEEFDLSEALTQCTRYCDHPTFDSAGVYHVTDPFRSTYAHDCYLPRYPELSDSGFPLDP